MLLQLGILAGTFAAGFYANTALRAYAEQTYPDEWAELKKAVEDFEKAKNDINGRIAKKWTADKIKVPPKVEELSLVRDSIMEAMSNVDWEKLQKESEKRWKEMVEAFKKEK